MDNNFSGYFSRRVTGIAMFIAEFTGNAASEGIRDCSNRALRPEIGTGRGPLLHADAYMHLIRQTGRAVAVLCTK